jgi:hypothetical protein
VLRAASAGTSACTWLSEIGKEGGKKDAKPETKKANNYALRTPTTRMATTPMRERACQQARKASQKAPLSNCITCKMVPRIHKSDKYNQCQLAVFASPCSASAPGLTAPPPRHRRLLLLSAVGVAGVGVLWVAPAPKGCLGVSTREPRAFPSSSSSTSGEPHGLVHLLSPSVVYNL